MFKNILYLSIISAVSISSHADALSDLETELLGGKDVPIDSVSFDDLDSLINSQPEEVEITPKDKSVTLPEAISSKNIDVVEVNPEEELLKVYETSDDLLNSEIYELDSSLATMDFSITDDKFLKYVPVGSHIVFNKPFYVPRTKDTFIFSFGKPTLQVDKNNFAACYIKFSKSDNPRELMAGREFEINKNITKKALIKNTNKTVYFSTFGIDNSHIDYVKCLSNKNDTPLTVNDFNAHFNDNVSIKFAEYEKI